MTDYLNPDPRVLWEDGPSESDDRGQDPARPGTLRTLNRLAEMKGYPPAKVGITEAEAKQAISWLTRLKRGDDGNAERLPAVPDVEFLPNQSLKGWRTDRP